MDIEDVKAAVEKHGGKRAAARALGIPESTIRRHLKGNLSGKPTPEPATLPDHAYVPETLWATHVEQGGVTTLERFNPEAVTRFILTSAQNNTTVHQAFLDNLIAFGKSLDAELLISYTVYDKAGYRGIIRKGESRIARSDVWWDKATQPYAVNDRVRLAPKLAFCGELDILATTADPLSGLDAYCGRSSVIVPHNKFAMRCVESRAGHMPKELWTTGSVTHRRFIQRKTGQLAAFHHVLGALLVEVTPSGHFHVHNLNADDDGSFYWLDKHVADGKVSRNRDGIAAVVLGDVHVEKSDGRVKHATMELLAELAPAHVFVHDLIDFRSRNHHNRDNPFFKIRMEREDATVKGELTEAGHLLRSMQLALPIKSQIVVVRSNHDEALDKWIREADWRQDPINALFYLETAVAMVRAMSQHGQFNAIKYHIRHMLYRDRMWSGRRMKLKPVKFLMLDESFEVAGVECGIHGHVGPSGSRGSPKGYSKLGFKSFTAHTHTPSIVHGCYTVGVMGSLNMGYNTGPSKWMQAHGIIYPNGKRAFLFYKNGQWRA